MTRYTQLNTKQFVALVLGLLLGVALFLSPIRLHHATRLLPSLAHEQHDITEEASQPTQHSHHHQENVRCLRCVLQTFETPETAQPLVVLLAVLGFLVVIKPLAPQRVVSLTKKARAPPFL
jgi:hypothetical protein